MCKTIARIISTSLLRSVWILLAAMLPALALSPAYAEGATHGSDSAQIMRDFTQQRVDSEREKSITEKDKHRIMFIMGVALIVLVLVTGGLGIAMVVYSKPVFLAHMIFAGLTVTLSLAHAVVGVVWFFPY
jgi:uncharacterized protein YqhQ